MKKGAVRHPCSSHQVVDLSDPDHVNDWTTSYGENEQHKQHKLCV